MPGYWSLNCHQQFFLSLCHGWALIFMLRVLWRTMSAKYQECGSGYIDKYNRGSGYTDTETHTHTHIEDPNMDICLSGGISRHSINVDSKLKYVFVFGRQFFLNTVFQKHPLNLKKHRDLTIVEWMSVIVWHTSFHPTIIVSSQATHCAITWEILSAIKCNSLRSSPRMSVAHRRINNLVSLEIGQVYKLYIETALLWFYEEYIYILTKPPLVLGHGKVISSA